MRAFCVLVYCVGFLGIWVNSQFLNNRPFPTYSLESMPDTDFSCRNKILGSYYADIETQCQMFHICVRVSGLGVQDFRFLCPNGTAFDQDHQICAEWEDVDCDYSTLYYASDNFDLYRIGSGFESKAVKYGEEEEVFALQRAETGDARISGDQQVYRVNQQKQLENANLRKSKAQNQYRANNNNNQNENNEEIFKGSSSSNFFNNRNRGKEFDEDGDDDKNVNYNQDRDFEQRRKVNRHQSRRPIKTEVTTTTTVAPTQRNNRPTGYLNNFAGSSFSTTQKPISSTEQQQQQHRIRQNVRKQYDYNNADNFRQIPRNYDDNNNNYPSTTYTISTPAPFRVNNQNHQPTTYSPKKIETYPSTQAKGFTKEPENYPSNFPKQFPTTPRNTNYDTNYEVTKVKNYETKKQADPTTFAPKTFSGQSSFPSTFSPRTNSGYTQISQQTTQQQKQNTQTNTFNTQTNAFNTQTNTFNTQTTQQRTTQYNNHNTQYNTQNTQYSTTQPPNTQYNTQYNTKPNQYSTNSQTTQYNTQNTQFNTQNTQYNTQNTQFNTQPFKTQQNSRTTQLTTSKPTPFTQYTPTVPKVTSTTPVSRSNRFDETQYDDGSYNSKYDNYDNNDEFLKTAHSTNIASSRNELAKNKLREGTTPKPQYDSPRPFSVTTSAPKVENKSTQKVTQSVAGGEKKEKNASYDYAYYDNNPPVEAEYDIDTEFKKSTAKQ